jgi:hypothetical protein
VIFTFTLLLLDGPCDESLPPYVEPEKLLEGRISGYYNGRELNVFLKVFNVYDETLEGTVLFNGSIEIESARKAELKKTLSLSTANLFIRSGYNSTTRQLTINPGDSVVFRAVWDFTADDRGVDPRRDLFVFYQDATCPGMRCVSSPEDFVLRGEIFVFKQRAPVRAETLFPVCYVAGSVPPNICPPVFTDPPCYDRPSLSNPRCYPYGQE